MMSLPFICKRTKFLFQFFFSELTGNQKPGYITKMSLDAKINTCFYFYEKIEAEENELSNILQVKTECTDVIYNYYV